MTTRRTPPADEITTQMGPTFATATGQTGARPGDHTHTKTTLIASSTAPRFSKKLSTGQNGRAIHRSSPAFATSVIEGNPTSGAPSSNSRTGVS